MKKIMEVKKTIRRDRRKSEGKSFRKERIALVENEKSWMTLLK